MASDPSEEIAHDVSPMLVVYKDGRVHRLSGNDTVPPSLDSETGVESKDILISPETGVSVRLYKPPKTTNSSSQKLPLLVYFHGGGFCIETAFSPTYHNHLNALVAEAKAIAVSVDYRRAPEHPLPTAHNDSWDSLKWVVSHFNGNGEEDWLNNNADFERVFLGGDSAGANIAHHVALRAGTEGLDGVKLRGLLLVHPYFWGGKLIGDEEKLDHRRIAVIENLWHLAFPSVGGVFDHPLINPDCDVNLGNIGGERVLICVAEKDAMNDRGWFYSESVKKSGWGGSVQVVETKDEGHVFHLSKPDSENGVDLLQKMAAFINYKD